MKKTVHEGELRALLRNWGTLNRGLLALTEPQVEAVLARELERARPRVFIALRLRSRLSKLRAERERRELLRRLGAT